MSSAQSARVRLQTLLVSRKPISRLAKSFFWSFSGGFASKAALLVTSLVAVRALDPVEFGTYIGMSATALLASFFWDFGLSTLLMREYAAHRLTTHGAIRQAISFRIKTLPLWTISFVLGTWILEHDHPMSAVTTLRYAGH